VPWLFPLIFTNTWLLISLFNVSTRLWNSLRHNKVTSDVSGRKLGVSTRSKLVMRAVVFRILMIAGAFAATILCYIKSTSDLVIGEHLYPTLFYAIFGMSFAGIAVSSTTLRSFIYHICYI
jgi:hypothetical protein